MRYLQLLLQHVGISLNSRVERLSPVGNLRSQRSVEIDGGGISSPRMAQISSVILRMAVSGPDICSMVQRASIPVISREHDEYLGQMPVFTITGGTASSSPSYTIQRCKVFQIPASLRMSGTLDSQPWAMMCTPWQ